MNSIGIGEIIIIFLIGFIFIGPEKLPKVIKKFKSALSDLFSIKNELEESFYEVKDEILNDKDKTE